MKIILHEINDPKEKALIKTVLEYSNKADKQNRAFFTDFYNAEWIKLTLQRHIGINNMCKHMLYGGYDTAERQMLGIFPACDITEAFPIGCLKVNVRTGIGKPLTHRDFLGALIGLGLERDRIGDIIVKPFGAYIIVKNNIIDYISYTLTGIGKYQNIEITEVCFSDLELEMPKLKEINTTVASLRIDGIIAAGFGLSRTTCTKLIQNDKATCNGMNVSPSYLLKEGDSVALRGYGKIKLKQINGITKKDRIHVCIEKYI
jgi:RNA-binding protein YlmH